MEIGPVTIGAKTRRREYSHAYTESQIDGFPSCKHLCCREGVEKAPKKAPKTSFVSAASLVGSSHIPGHNSRAGHIFTAKKSAGPSIHRNEQEADIETIDMASCQTSGTLEKTPPRAFKSLSRLYDKVGKGRTAPVATKKQASSGYTNEGQPQTPFFNEDASAEASSNKPSTDYDADWMVDLPSPSTLLAKPRKSPGPLPEHTSTYYGSSWPDNLPSPSALIRQDDTATRDHRDHDSPRGVDLSQFSNDESDLEAAMVGLSDSVHMQEDSHAKAAIGQTYPQGDAFPRRLPNLDEFPSKLQHRPTFKAESSGTSRLFLSTDGPEECAEPGQKRKAAVTNLAEDLSQSAPVPKRPRLRDESDQAPKASSRAEQQAKPPNPLIKPGQPAWVYDFDPPSFIIEYQDIVEFV